MLICEGDGGMGFCIGGEKIEFFEIGFEIGFVEIDVDECCVN